VALKHVSEPIPNVQDFVPETPDGVRAVIERAMAKEAADRFTSATEMAETLAQVWDTTEMQPVKPGPLMPANLPLPVEPVPLNFSTHRPPTQPLPPRSTTSQKRPVGIWSGIAILVLLFLVVGAWLSFRQNGQPNETAAQAQTIIETSTATPTATSPPATSVNTDTPPPTAVAIALEAASPSPTITATDPPAATPTDTPTPSPTVSPTLAATASPTATETPIPVPTATPSAVPTAPPTTQELLAGLRGKILFKTDRSGRVDIYKMEADGSAQEPLGPDFTYLYNEAVRWESYASDRKRAVVVRGEGQLDLWWVNAIEGGEGRITIDGAADYDAVWSPLDDRIVFVSERTGNGDLYLLNLNGSGEKRLTFNEADFDKHPSWSPDATQIVFWSDRGWNKNSQVWLYDLETEETVSLSNNPYRDWDPVWVK
jgi:hypothetical protein